MNDSFSNDFIINSIIHLHLRSYQVSYVPCLVDLMSLLCI